MIDATSWTLFSSLGPLQLAIFAALRLEADHVEAGSPGRSISGV